MPRNASTGSGRSNDVRGDANGGPPLNQRVGSRMAADDAFPSFLTYEIVDWDDKGMMSPIKRNIGSETPAQSRKAIGEIALKAGLTGLLFAFAMGGTVPAQTIKTEDDGTILKGIIIFGRHGIRASTSDPSILNKYSAEPYPAFSVAPGCLTTNGMRAAGLLGSYFHDYLIHEVLLTGHPDADLARSYFRANTIERSYMTAAKFGAGLIPNADIPVHTYAAGRPDPVIDPLLAMVSTVDPVRAVTEARGVFGNGTNLASAYSGELSLS
jgi:hypothetical protein